MSGSGIILWGAASLILALLTVGFLTGIWWPAAFLLGAAAAALVIAFVMHW